mgnify:CR=1 FL=1
MNQGCDWHANKHFWPRVKFIFFENHCQSRSFTRVCGWIMWRIDGNIVKLNTVQYLFLRLSSLDQAMNFIWSRLPSLLWQQNSLCYILSNKVGQYRESDPKLVTLKRSKTCPNQSTRSAKPEIEMYWCCTCMFYSADTTSRYLTASVCAGDYEEKKPETFESVPVILSPSVRYASSHHFTQPVEWVSQLP